MTSHDYRLSQIEMSQGDYTTMMGILTDNMKEGVNIDTLVPIEDSPLERFEDSENSFDSAFTSSSE